MKYTKKQKLEYFKKLRADWKKSKELADNDKEAQALFREVQKNGGKFSYYSFYFTLLDMKKLKLKGIPYVDCKTFGGWKNAGFTLKEKQKCKIHGITWVGAKSKENEDEENSFMYPKVYNLFHKSQVKAIK